MSSPASSASSTRPQISRAWYSDTIPDFLRTTSETIVGALITNSTFDVSTDQRDAWLIQLKLLRSTLSGLNGSIFLEFSIPRIGRRIDAVVIVGAAIFAIEFKVGAQVFSRTAREQVWDYALDLKNFHEASHAAQIVPILVRTGSAVSSKPMLKADSDGVFQPILVGGDGMRPTIDVALATIINPPIDVAAWSIAPYLPTPTIIEAARALYAQHSVEAIARHDAGARNLAVTSRRLDDLVDIAMANRQKLICFVTGVPGAGKTLVGLNVATRHRHELGKPSHAVFLSGNGPLVAVLREALTRDEVSRRKHVGEKATKGHVANRVKAFVQNVHHFRDEALHNSLPPADHVVIFDEAQRAWNLRQTANFMHRKRKQPGFAQTEPEFLIAYMDRHLDWAVIVCLVGGGQEINTGEAGIDAWLDAVQTKFPHWRMHISPRLTDSEYAAGQALERVRSFPHSHFDESLHLSVSMRSFRAENVSAFVKALLDCELDIARSNFAMLKARYPIVLTRDLSQAKKWVRLRARGSERFGLVASSKALRLKPHAIDVRIDVNPVLWFLNDRDDTRSSFYLEDAATEFHVQGLELDWTLVAWNGDLRFVDGCWSYHDFRGSRWCDINSPERRQYLRNAYRVLLTRARQGMVIFIPPGDRDDHTRPPEYYDETFSYLQSIGMPVID